MGHQFEYVYRLRSLAFPTEVYTGRTSNVGSRLKKHNAGQVSHTSKFIPWQLELAIAFRGSRSEKEGAQAVEEEITRRIRG